MLQSMRDGAQSLIIKIFFSALLIMAVAGLVLMDAGGFFRGGLSGNVVAEAGKARISLQEFDRDLRRRMQSFGIDTQTAYRFGLVDRVLEEEIARALLYQAALDAGLFVGNQTIAAALLRVFGEDAQGEWTAQDSFNTHLATQGLTEAEFVEGLRKEFALGLLRQAAEGVARTPPDSLARALARHAGEKRDIDFMFLKDSAVPTPAPPTADALQARYESLKATFALPERRVFTFVSLAGESLSGILARTHDITPDIQEAAQNGDPAKISLITDSVRDLMNMIDDRLAGGEDLPDIAQDFGLDLVTLPALDDQGQWDPQSPEDAAYPDLQEIFGFDLPYILESGFILLTGETAPPLEMRDGNGFVLLRLDQIIPADFQPFDSVQDTLVAGWIAQERTALNAKRAQEAQSALADGEKTLSALARDLDAPLETLEDVTRTHDLDLLDDTALQAFFDAEPDVPLLLPVAGGQIVGHVTAVHTPAPESLTADEIAEMKKQIAETQAGEFITLYLAALEQDKGVKIHRRLLDAAYGTDPAAQGDGAF